MESDDMANLSYDTSKSPKSNISHYNISPVIPEEEIALSQQPKYDLPYAACKSTNPNNENNSALNHELTRTPNQQITENYQKPSNLNQPDHDNNNTSPDFNPGLVKIPEQSITLNEQTLSNLNPQEIPKHNLSYDYGHINSYNDENSLIYNPDITKISIQTKDLNDLIRSNLNSQGCNNNNNSIFNPELTSIPNQPKSINTQVQMDLNQLSNNIQPGDTDDSMSQDIERSLALLTQPSSQAISSSYIPINQHTILPNTGSYVIPENYLTVSNLTYQQLQEVNIKVSQGNGINYSQFSSVNFPEVISIGIPEASNFPLTTQTIQPMENKGKIKKEKKGRKKTSPKAKAKLKAKTNINGEENSNDIDLEAKNKVNNRKRALEAKTGLEVDSTINGAEKTNNIEVEVKTKGKPRKRVLKPKIESEIMPDITVEENIHNDKSDVKNKEKERKKVSKSKTELKVTPSIINNYNETPPFNYNYEDYNEISLWKSSDNFIEPVYAEINEGNQEDWKRVINKILINSVDNGIPVIVRGLHLLSNFDTKLFSLDKLMDELKDTEITVRDLNIREDKVMTYKQYMDEMDGKKGVDKGGVMEEKEVKEGPSEHKLYYGKDLQVPKGWINSINSLIPSYLQYKGCNDLNNLSSQPTDNLMIYVGHEGTYTSAHNDICGSVGHNIMVATAGGSSALWFLTPYKNRNEARRLWAQYGGGNTSLDQDNCLLPKEVLEEAEFEIYCFEQRIGDLVIVPSECPHQVINVGKGCNVKYSWNRITPISLKHSIESVNPINRQILKPEIYRTRYAVENSVHILVEWLKDQNIEQISKYGYNSIELNADIYKCFMEDLKVLLKLFITIVSELVINYPNLKRKKNIQPTIEDSQENIVCDFCRADIWNTHFECTECFENHDICVHCLAKGRTCINIKKIKYVCIKDIDERIKYLLESIQMFNGSILQLNIDVVPFDIEKVKKNIYKKKCDYTPLTLALLNLTKIKSKDVIQPCYLCNKMRRNFEHVECQSCNKQVCHWCILDHNEDASTQGYCRMWHCYDCIVNCKCYTCKERKKLNLDLEVELLKIEQRDTAQSNISLNANVDNTDQATLEHIIQVSDQGQFIIGCSKDINVMKEDRLTLNVSKYSNSDQPTLNVDDQSNLDQSTLSVDKQNDLGQPTSDVNAQNNPEQPMLKTGSNVQCIHESQVGLETQPQTNMQEQFTVDVNNNLIINQADYGPRGFRQTDYNKIYYLSDGFVYYKYDHCSAIIPCASDISTLVSARQIYLENEKLFTQVIKVNNKVGNKRKAENNEQDVNEDKDKDELGGINGQEEDKSDKIELDVINDEEENKEYKMELYVSEGKEGGNENKIELNAPNVKAKKGSRQKEDKIEPPKKRGRKSRKTKRKIS